MPALVLTPDELLTTTRSVRRRLDLDRPVERALIAECLEIALQAPTASNRHSWHFVVVELPRFDGAISSHGPPPVSRPGPLRAAGRPCRTRRRTAGCPSDRRRAA